MNDKRSLKEGLLSLLAVILTAIFPVVFLYANNADEANFVEVIQPLGLFILIGLVVFGIIFLMTKSFGKAALCSVMFSLMFANFALLEQGLKLLLPSLRYWHTAAIILAVWVHIALAICLFGKKDFLEIGITIVPIVFGALIVINMVTAIPAIANKMSIASQTKQENESSSSAQQMADGDLPNIYLLIFDEFAGFHQMEKYYNYDNADLKNFLMEHNFTISYNSYNESIYTAMITANLVNLDYVVWNNNSVAEAQMARENGALFNLLSNMGYEIHKLADNNFYGESYSIENNMGNSSSEAATINGETLKDLLYQNTAIYPFIPKLTFVNFPYLDFLKNPSNIPVTPTFTLMHVNLPHQPFYFDENGDPISPSDRLNWTDNEIYLGQYIYASKLMMEVVNNLVENDPDALIMVMSDHGARASGVPDLFMKKFTLDDMRNIFNVFYYQGMDLSDYVDKSGVNTIRTLLNLVLGTDYSEVEVPIDDESNDS